MAKNKSKKDKIKRFSPSEQTLIRGAKRRLKRQDVLVRGSLPGYTRKLSEVIMEFAEALHGELPEDDSAKMLLQLAILAWNLASLPEDIWDDTEKELFEKLGIDPSSYEGVTVEAFLREMTLQRQMMYPDDRRLVLDYQLLRDAHGDLRLEVISTDLRKDGER